MKKSSFLFSILAITLVFGFTLASCGGNDGSNNSPNNTPSGNTPGDNQQGGNPGGILGPSGNTPGDNTPSGSNTDVSGTYYSYNNQIYRGQAMTFNSNGAFILNDHGLISRGTYYVSGNIVYYAYNSGRMSDILGNVDTLGMNILNSTTLLHGLSTQFIKRSTPPGATTGGTLTVTGIPSQYNGKYAAFIGSAKGKTFYGAQGFDMLDIFIGVQIANGSVSLPMWEQGSNGVRYSGNDTIPGWFNVYGFIPDDFYKANTDTTAIASSVLLLDNSVTFSNGNATVMWSSGEIETR